MDPRRREVSRKKPEEEKPQEEIPEWQGVLFIENFEKKIIRIASVICCPPPPVPLPTRVQLNKEFIKMKHTMYQVCIGLPFFELHKADFKYNPRSEWTKFLNFMLENQKFATIMCPGWKLYLQPPQEDPPHGFRPVRVHYERSPVDPMTVTEGSMTVDKAPLTEPVVPGSAPSLGEYGMEVELEEVQIDDTANLKCDQPKLKRPRREVELHAPSSTQEEAVSKGNSCAIETMNVVNERQPPCHGNDATVGKVAGCKLDRIEALSLKHTVPKVVSEVKEKAPEMVDHNASSGAAPATEERMETYFTFNGAGSRLGNEGLYLKHDELATVATVVSKVKEKAPEMDLVNRKATSSAAPATDERMENYFNDPAVEPSQCRMKKRISVYPKPGAKQSRGRLMKHYSKTLLTEKLEGGGRNTDVPIPTAFVNGDFRMGKVVVDKGKGRMSIKKKKVPSDGSIMRKTSYNGSIMKKRSSNGSIKNHIVHALPHVPEQFRVNLSSGGASSKDSRGDLSSGGVSSKDFRVVNLGSSGETSKDFRLNLSSDGASSKEEMLRGVECCKDVWQSNFHYNRERSLHCTRQ